ncbi:hypothetical protein Ae201684P_001819 [Aphanomyces euteiches]|uniref:DUF8040 domain-containing protein n=1 Tax=Aphanomyces euteiches TaxID=100861 RepID=A0A6G0XKC9_9STRA|nr:hypothetical protein Ae201684_003837 [Aphanomyces euteiches]KAH9084577.1 hypothetical protein Ae201684P_001819 [Aphanomyces euteiches]KAH9142531.1 hypothetical protein AeRB84_013407 [Aphanomyces euteiches]
MVDRRLILMFIRRWIKLRRRDLLHKYLRYHFTSFVFKTPKRVSILSGRLWMAEMLGGNEEAFVENFRMPKAIFCALSRELEQHGHLYHSRQLDINEQLGIFLYFAGQHASSAQLQQRFQHSGETITRHLHALVKSILKLTSTYIQIPAENSHVPREIHANPKFYPFFEKCRMAVDGTHIPVWVPENMVAPFQGRKGITMNVLAACDFDMNFTYVLAGWEGSAGCSQLYSYAWLP